MFNEQGIPTTVWEDQGWFSHTVRAYYKFFTNMFNEQGIPTTVWEDQGWFAVMQNGQFVNGIGDAILNCTGCTAEDGAERISCLFPAMLTLLVSLVYLGF